MSLRRSNRLRTTNAPNKRKGKDANAKKPMEATLARKIARKMRQLSSQGQHLTEWESDFVSSVSERLDRFGSAFRDPEKGQIGKPLSYLQAFKMFEVSAKVRKKAKDEREQEPDAAERNAGWRSIGARKSRK